MKVSLIVINHNYASYLRSSIESCLNQSTSPYEVIVIDDGSTDNSHDVIKEYAGRVNYTLNSNQGHVASVNDGFKLSSGDVCVFIDADDILYPDCVRCILLYWEGSLSKVQFRLDTIDKVGKNQFMTFPHYPKSLTSEEIFRQSVFYGVYPWSVSTGNAYARSFLNEIMPIDSSRIYRSPDGYLNKIAPLFGPVKCIAEVLGAYRVHGSNAWAQDSKTLRPEPICRWLNFDKVLQCAFQEIADKRHVEVNRSLEIRSLQQLEYRMLGCRFNIKGTPYIDDSFLSLVGKGLLFLRSAPNVNFVGRVSWSVWICVLGFCPKFLVAAIVTSARGQIGRQNLFKKIVDLSRRGI